MRGARSTFMRPLYAVVAEEADCACIGKHAVFSQAIDANTPFADVSRSLSSTAIVLADES